VARRKRDSAAEIDLFEVAMRTAPVAPERLLGFLQTPWCPMIEECRGTHVNAIDLIRRAREGFR
jgi:hypothetical protein